MAALTERVNEFATLGCINVWASIYLLGGLIQVATDNSGGFGAMPLKRFWVARKAAYSVNGGVSLGRNIETPCLCDFRHREDGLKPLFLHWNEIPTENELG